jgi:hypothetical protein
MELNYRGFWVTFARAGRGWRWNIENRAGIVLRKGEQMFETEAEAQSDAYHEIDAMVGTDGPN